MNTPDAVTTPRPAAAIGPDSGVSLSRIAALKLSMEICRTFLSEIRVQTALTACAEIIGRTLPLLRVSISADLVDGEPTTVIHSPGRIAPDLSPADPPAVYEVSVPLRGEEEAVGNLTVTGPLPKPDGLLAFLEEIASEISGCLRNVRRWADASIRLRDLSALKPSTLIGIAGLDRNHRVTAWNAGCRVILGWRSDEALGRELSAVVGSSACSQLQAPLQSALQGWRTDPCQLSLRRWDGREVPVTVEVLPLETAPDGHLELRLVIRDESTASKWERLNDIVSGVSELLEGFTSIEAVTEPMLREVCSGMGWLRGELWQFEPAKADWKIVGLWNANALPPEATGSETDNEFVHSLLETVREKRGIVRFENLAEASSETARNAAAQQGLHEAVGIPVLLEGDLTTLMLFFGFEIAPTDEASSGTLQAVASQIAMLLKKEQFERNLHEAQQNLAQSQKMEAVGLLAGGVAHDFNNLLTIILGSSEIALELIEEDSPATGMVREIENAGRRAADLTQQLLAFSRKQPLETAILNVNTRIQATQKMLQRLTGEQIELTFQPDEPIHMTRFDPVQFDQVLLNLTVNARDAISGAGRITVATANRTLSAAAAREYSGGRSGEFVVVSVTDTGCGMDEATAAHVFEPFFTTKEQGKGTGMGLATVFGIVSQSGGFMAIQSRPGQGTTMSIFLPRTHDVPKTLEVHSHPTTQLTGEESVLLVEDEEVLRSLAAQMLEARGYSVLQAAGGEEALDFLKAKRGHVNLLVTDVMMPGMTGPALVSRMHADGYSIPVLLMSGYDDDVFQSREVETAEFPLLRKPFTSEDLALAVRTVLDSSLHPGAGD